MNKSTPEISTMELIRTTNKEYHENGSLKYIETVAIIPPLFSCLYKNTRIHPEGHEWIRVGKQAKYYDNGQLAWALNYTDEGDVMKGNNNNQYRKDGTHIVY